MAEAAQFPEKADTELALQAMQTHMENLTESLEEFKTSPADQPRLGKCKLPFAIFEQRSVARLAELERQMDALDKTTPMWQKLRKQKLAQKARLENRRKEFMKNSEVSKLERVI